MFGRSSTPETKSPEAPAPKPAEPIAAAAPTPTPPRRSGPFGDAARMTASVIGTDLTILGERITIISKHQLQIDGDVRADVNGRQVVIGEEGSVTGTVSAESIEVRGGVRGALKAQTVTLHPSAVVEGDILHQTLSIAEGAQFDGRVRRSKDPAELEPVLDPAGIAPAHPPAGG